ncbi:MAG TPA: hypothetical protein VKT77_07300, partial [Chthonomonadaceae bacterium]|nr:hypothetical protein [Chthonomonadaceae bacterium]
FGNANPEPSFVCRGVRIQSIETMGKEQEHLRFILGVEGPNRWGTIKAPWFSHGALAHALQAFTSLDICFAPKINTWNDRRSVEFTVQDIAATEW